MHVEVHVQDARKAALHMQDSQHYVVHAAEPRGTVSSRVVPSASPIDSNIGGASNKLIRCAERCAGGEAAVLPQPWKPGAIFSEAAILARALALDTRVAALRRSARRRARAWAELHSI
jgi:hypothetical protein